MSVKYPRRLTFLRVGYCDACNRYIEDKNSCICYVGSYSMKMGWQHCKKCTDIIKDWKLKCTIPKKEVVSELGENFNVVRSNGKKEFGWTVKCEAVKYTPHEDWSVHVYLERKHLTKIISLTDLKKWN